MDTLINKSHQLIRSFSLPHRRYLYQEIPWDNQLIGIKGSRGTGKTTLLFQRLQALKLPPTEASYWSLDDLFFTEHSLAETAKQFYREGGRWLFLDEVHKYPRWSRHIKNLYDELKELNIVFTGSSIIDIAKEEVDLSRRALIYVLHGLSFREYLFFRHAIELPVLSLSEIVKSDGTWQNELPSDFQPLKYFQNFLQRGYYPFSLEDEKNFEKRLQQVIRIIVEYDLSALDNFDIRNAQKLLQLLYIIANNVPFKPNISRLAKKTQIHRNTINRYLYFLNQAQLTRSLYPSGISLSSLQKPEKILLNNPNLAYVISGGQPNIGSVRESFFASQTAVNHQVALPKKGDFIIDDKWIFEVGGKNKSYQQIKDIKHSFVVADDLDFPIKKLPLWVFGMLY